MASKPGARPNAIPLASRPAPYSKFRNVRCEVDGEKFDSKAEMKRWQMLKILERAGAIKDLRRQETIELRVGCALIGKMRWDFTYVEGGRLIFDDTKGMKPTPEWRLKAKLCAVLYPAELRINGVRMA